MRPCPWILPFLTLAFSVAGTDAFAQGLGTGEPGLRELLPRAEEIALARSAAPAYVSDEAEVWVLGAKGYEMAAGGTNGVACMVSRDWLVSLEPICYDPEGAETIMRIAMRRLELLHAGTPVAETDAIVSTELASGALRLPTRPSMAYMLSAAQRLVSDEGTPVGAWRPHLMIYQPYLTGADLGLPGDGNLETVVVSSAGTATASMVIVLPDFVEPRSAGER